MSNFYFSYRMALPSLNDMAIVGSCFRFRWFGSFVKSPNSKTPLFKKAYCEQEWKLAHGYFVKKSSFNFAFVRGGNHNSLLYNQKPKIATESYANGESVQICIVFCKCYGNRRRNKADYEVRLKKLLFSFCIVKETIEKSMLRTLAEIEHEKQPYSIWQLLAVAIASVCVQCDKIFYILRSREQATHHLWHLRTKLISQKQLEMERINPLVVNRFEHERFIKNHHFSHEFSK
ncbi:hypothetical protein T10_9963 [Trichinella papuae]|uniref:Uncharacterized protein n=1 Tax=Trichinella papuae TaxID=268474 RepID=A0A0V1MBQ3_9BILA|nr:hypothetical protein T10_9963 [Trichinella papuae]